MTEKKTPKKTAEKQPGRNGGGKAFKPGESGNPNGRPKKGTSWREIVAQATNEVRAVEGVETDVMVKRIIVDKQVNLAIGGDRYATKFLAEREEGAPAQHIEHTGAIPVEFTGDNAADYINSKLDE